MQFWRGWGWSLLLALVLATSIRSAIADWNIVPTGSMKPTILEGDRIFVNKLAYDLKVPYTTWHLASWSDPQRGDIVVFFSPSDGTRLVKRVIGLPGDVIFMDNNRLFINGEAVRYEAVDPGSIGQIAPGQRSSYFFFNENMDGEKHSVMFAPSRLSRRSFGSIIVPQGRYFLMGDNRDESADSRYFGFVERGRIVGQATAIVMSLKPDEHHLPRWQRFFKKLS